MKINPDKYYAILSDNDYLGVGEDFVYPDNYLSYRFEQTHLVRMGASDRIPELDASPEQLAALASSTPHIATELLSGFFYANQAFIDEYSQIDPTMRAFPVRFHNSDVEAYMISTTTTVTGEALKHSEDLIYREEFSHLPIDERQIKKVERLVVTEDPAQPLGMFRVPQYLQQTFVAGEIAQWFLDNGPRLGIYLTYEGRIHRETQEPKPA
ncbi:hypothetical protein P4N68_11720 [Corynebacterium felinum]|uniref:Uncharacterized protein n=1 Tax=Corynebacterium felinum TaxID=131318 RepID=A0ABU2B5S4_9CORY|nr:hypothetical protein [Corynebacterium felinum]MDF5821738.1 hypothetical protein [Corynebacterium felinum]MDR7353971.1 hypothetical protein [Corynebacterium felinum]WJY96144.1 hypothetical protein CFELI_12825 [Corynebacterium felinum]